MKSIRECVNAYNGDLPTVLWTRGRAFPHARDPSVPFALRIAEGRGIFRAAHEHHAATRAG
jgi:hypothetical protein